MCMTPPPSWSGSRVCGSFDVIRYAQKACSNLAILDLMRRQGVLVDAVSAGEIQRTWRPDIGREEIRQISCIRRIFLITMPFGWSSSRIFM